MANSRSILLNICLLVILIGCSPVKSKSPQAETSSHLVSNNYKPPIFINDDRREQIKNIGPELQELIMEHARVKNIPGIAYGIVVDNELVISSGIGFLNIDAGLPATRKSAFRIASMTKSFTAMAIMKLRDEGKLALSDPASKYIPEMSALEYLTTDAGPIDIKNLLTMTAGFPEDNPWGDRQLDETDEMLMALVRQGISFANVPSFEYEYSNTGYTLLGNIISRISGVPFQEYIQENILHPLGMNHTYWEYDNVPSDNLALGYCREDEQWKLVPMLHDGAFGCMGGLITSIEDFGKYVSFQLSAWPARSNEETGPVKRSSLREMQTVQFPSLNLENKSFDGDQCPSISGYGYGLRISKDCQGIKRVAHSGALPGFSSSYIFYPDYGVGIMAFGNLTYTGPLPSSKIEKLLFETLQLKPRLLQVSDILAKRQEQVLELIQTWDTNLEKEIVAENLYMDETREKRIARAQKIFEKAGEITEVDKIEPISQLKGTFRIHAENGVIEVYFALNPEKDPRIQELDLTFVQNQTLLGY